MVSSRLSNTCINCYLDGCKLRGKESKLLCAGSGSRLVEVGGPGASPVAAPTAAGSGPPPGPVANYQVRQIQGPSRPPASPISTSSAPGLLLLCCPRKNRGLLELSLKNLKAVNPTLHWPWQRCLKRGVLCCFMPSEIGR